MCRDQGGSGTPEGAASEARSRGLALRVSKALVHLPRLAAAFERGDLSWSLLAALTRVADGETEGEWLEFLEGRSVRAVLAELKDAEKKRRKRPRRDGYGLPGLPVKLSFELSPQDYAAVEQGLEKVATEMGRGLDGAKPSPTEALIFLMLRVLETDPEGSVTAGRVEREHSPFTVAFHRCPDCRRAAVESVEGRVEVAAEAMDRIEAVAEHVVINFEAPEATTEIQVRSGERDRPNTSAMRRALFHREGGRCANPYCRTSGLHIERAAGYCRGSGQRAASRQPPAASRQPPAGPRGARTHERSRSGACRRGRRGVRNSGLCVPDICSPAIGSGSAVRSRGGCRRGPRRAGMVTCGGDPTPGASAGTPPRAGRGPGHGRGGELASGGAARVTSPTLRKRSERSKRSKRRLARASPGPDGPVGPLPMTGG